MKKKCQKIVLLTLILFSYSAISQITVDNKEGTNAMFTSIQEAITAANSGDTIYVHPSETTYTGPSNRTISIDKPIVLIGRTPKTKPATISNIEIKLAGSGTIIKGLKISSISTTLATNLLFENNEINNISYGNPIGNERIATVRGNVINSLFNTRKTLITNNIITSRVTIRSISTVFKNNLLQSSTIINNSDIRDARKALIQNCIFVANSTGVATIKPNNLNITNSLYFNFGGGTLNIDKTCINCSFTDVFENTDPKFIKFSGNLQDINNDYTLQSDSSALSAGTNQEQIGIMGNGYSFRPSLHPFGFPTVQILTNNAQVPENGVLKVTFSGNSN